MHSALPAAGSKQRRRHLAVQAHACAPGCTPPQRRAAPPGRQSPRPASRGNTAPARRTSALRRCLLTHLYNRGQGVPQGGRLRYQAPTPAVHCRAKQRRCQCVVQRPQLRYHVVTALHIVTFLALTVRSCCNETAGSWMAHGESFLFCWALDCVQGAVHQQYSRHRDLQPIHTPVKRSSQPSLDSEDESLCVRKLQGQLYILTSWKR